MDYTDKFKIINEKYKAQFGINDNPETIPEKVSQFNKLGFEI